MLVRVGGDVCPSDQVKRGGRTLLGGKTPKEELSSCLFFFLIGGESARFLFALSTGHCSLRVSWVYSACHHGVRSFK